MNLRLIGFIVMFCTVATCAVGWQFFTPGGDVPSSRADRVSFSHDGRNRTYQVIHPNPLPESPRIVLVLHPSRASGDDMRRMIGNVLEPLAKRDGFIVAYPDGFENHFNDCRAAASYSARSLRIDDVGFLKAIITRLASERGADTANVVVVGYSNGAHMGLRLAIEAPEVIDSLIMIAANVPTKENMACEGKSKLRRAVLIEGTEDPINPFEGGRVTLFGFGNRGTVLSAQDSSSWLAADESSLMPPTSIGDAAGLDASMQDRITTQGGVRLITIHGGGHVIPQSHYDFMPALGARYPEDDVFENAWSFVIGDSTSLTTSRLLSLLSGNYEKTALF